ncbi:glycoside hydrolase family 25 protein [Antrihabitans sp. YC2-6]|uniref:glycoside hydrolase family 25 protein n=1 Tax=Antrihabitans sp. YC2-6 TaxID=2799498 RepID=UPI0018F2C541|nr:glycoside hydrolase family 25 protein [Antrihabitans sp. YC2-6]
MARSGLRRKLLAALPLAVVAMLIAASPGSADPRPSGPDVSGWQHPSGAPIDWFAVKSAGHDFALVKATEGTNYVNPHFQQDTASMRAAGVLRGAYHFPRFDQNNPEEQALFYVQNVFQQNVLGSLPPILDVERSNGMPADVIINWMHRWLTTVKVLTGRNPIVYTCPGFWKYEVANSNQFTSYPLWIADWTGSPQPELVGGWPNWVFWQQTDRANIPGIDAPSDSNVYNGDMGPLMVWANTPYYISMGSS